MLTMRCTRWLAGLGLMALAAGCARPAAAPAAAPAPVAISDTEHGLLVSVAGDGTITDARGARIGSFDAKTSVITMTSGQPIQMRMAGTVTVTGDHIVIDTPGFAEGKLAFDLGADGALLYNGRRWGSVQNAGITPADRWRLAAGLVVIPMLPPSPELRH